MADRRDMELIFDESSAVSERFGGDITGLMERAAALILEREQIDSERCEISVTFVTGEEIRELNRDYRGVDRVTDVLSFPQFEADEDFPDEGPISLGDVVICRDKIVEQAEEFGHSEAREAVYLFTHSVLHLLGYDHETDEEKSEMRAAKEEIMQALELTR